MASPPKWALDIATVASDKVTAWVEGAKGKKWRAPIMLVTSDEVLWVTSGLYRKQCHRVSWKNVNSVAYETGVVWDTLYLSVAGEELRDTSIRINRKRRESAHQVLEILHRGLGMRVNP